MLLSMRIDTAALGFSTEFLALFALQSWKEFGEHGYGQYICNIIMKRQNQTKY